MEVRASYPDDSGPRNFSWVVPDALAAMGCPSSLGELRTLAARGLCHLVSLSEEELPPGVSITSILFCNAFLEDIIFIQYIYIYISLQNENNITE